MTTPNNTVEGLVAKLLPCPFCGGEAASFGDDAIGYNIACFDHDCFGAHRAWWDRGETIAAWNRRASPAPSAGVGVDEVDDAMAERAWRAGRVEYSKRVKLSSEWDEPDADDIASMRAALTAALASKEGA